MKVLFLAHSFPRHATDPVGSFILRLAVALRDEGVEVSVLAPAAPGLAARGEIEGISVRRFRYAPRRLETLAYTGTMRAQVRESWGARLALGGFLVAELAAAWKMRRTFQPDLLHAHWWFPAGLVGCYVGAVTGTPLVTTLHGSDLRLAKGVPVAARLFRSVVRRSAAVTTVSRWLAQETELLASGSRAVVAPMPVLPDLFSPAGGGAGERRPNSLLFVGKLNSQKGIGHLLRAMALMRVTATLDVVVGVGSEEDEARRLATDLGVADRIRWHPLLEQARLAQLYRQATALIVPALDEGLGLTAVEALMCETPVVAFASGGLTDSVIDGRTGLLAPPGDVRGLAEQIDRLLTSPDQGAALGRAGREHVLARFSPCASARRYADIYRSIVAPPRP
ncbi:MAG: glycosyltransferase [Gemmatimonadota bacterium]|nr:glycosyltransferase [Gemmatimonadota bacterium]